MTNALVLWTVYDHPRDYPDGFVARKFLIGPDSVKATDDLRHAPTLEALRHQLPRGLACLARNDGDDPCIVESWI